MNTLGSCIIVYLGGVLLLCATAGFYLGIRETPFSKLSEKQSGGLVFTVVFWPLMPIYWLLSFSFWLMNNGPYRLGRKIKKDVEWHRTVQERKKAENVTFDKPIPSEEKL
jgi:hypothetical protein